MKPHSLRRGLWFANLALGAGVIALAAWLVLSVRPAAAKVIERKANVLPKGLDAVRKKYKAERVTGLNWKPTAPVSEADIKKVIIRADYAKKSPRHWIFSGPLPPVAVAATGPVDTGPPPPEGLDVLGVISMVAGGASNGYTIGFRFGKKTLAFSEGDFVRQSDKDPARFKLTKIEEVRPFVFEVSYEVYGKDAEKPERTGKLTYDRSEAASSAPWLRPVGAAGIAAPEPGAAEATSGGTGPAVEGSGTKGEKTAPAKTADGATVIDVTKQGRDLTLRDLKPTIEVSKRNRNERTILFDRNSYDYFRGRKAKNIASTVKTNVAKDKNGRVLGLRITGFAKDAPADVFDVRRGDILVSIAGQKVSSRSDAVRIAEHLDPKRIVTVVIDRLGKLITYHVDPNDPKNRRKVRYFDNLK